MVNEVGFLIRIGDEDVIDAGEAEGNALYHLIDEALECLDCVLLSKRHPCALKQAKRSDNGCFRDVVRMDIDLVKAFHQVEAGEDGGTREL